MNLKLKRDITSINPPAPNQLEVGELVINSKTGKLYTKLIDGTIVEFISRQVCYMPIPTIVFDDISNFCCAQPDTFSVKVRGLEASNTQYTFNVVELTDNNAVFSTDSVSYNNYTDSGGGKAYNEAIIPVTGTILGSDSITILKFSVLLNNQVITEKTVSICCKNCPN
jgi:hypothetical protein